MHIDLMRDLNSRFPPPGNPSEVHSLRIWHCKYKTLMPIAELTNLRELVVGSFPDASLNMLAGLTQLCYLRILHLPKVSDLTPLGGLKNIRSLSLATSPSWDAAGKKTFVDSLAPIALIEALMHLELFGVCPPDMSLAPLERCKNLRSARFSQYPKNEAERFYQVMGISNAFNPPPSFPELPTLRAQGANWS